MRRVRPPAANLETINIPYFVESARGTAPQTQMLSETSAQQGNADYAEYPHRIGLRVRGMSRLRRIVPLLRLHTVAAGATTTKSDERDTVICHTL